MRAGRLQTRRYRVRRTRRRVFLVLALLGIGAFFLARSPVFPRLQAYFLSLLPGAPALPDEGMAETREVTLPGGQWHALSLGTYRDAAAARQAADSFRARGAGGYRDGENRLLAAAYPARADAQQVQKRLLAHHGLETAQTEIAWPEIRFRLTGRKDQLDAVEDALRLLSQTAEQLFSLSSGLDKRTMDETAARQALASWRDTLSAQASRLDGCFGGAAPEAAEQLRGQIAFLADALKTALEEQGSVRLGAQIKYCHLAALCRLQSWANTLAE
ncbi:MAG: hypothetical protein K5919_07615 [Clostridiales bacterium]|nr:hypothetical protein [Clostridiales bacterium]